MTSTPPSRLSDLIQDYVILGMPPDVDPDSPDVREALNRLAERQVLMQYKGKPPKALVIDPIEWLITSDWRDVEAFQPAHDCEDCRSGNERAIALLKEHPTKRLALGNMTYLEMW
jgi:hypothetical protein